MSPIDRSAAPLSRRDLLRRALALPTLPAGACAGLAAAAGSGSCAAVRGVLRNVSYDPTRALYEELNGMFLDQWRQGGGEPLRLEQSHGGSGKQARAVLDGLDADVVTLALAYDIDAIAARGGLLEQDWQRRLPHNSCPYTSVIVFLVRKGNPRGIRDWADLVQPGVAVITPNPKTSGGARWNHLAAWGAVWRATGSDGEATAYLEALYRNVPLLDAGARAATTTFVQRRLGDVLITWESEAHLARTEFADEGLEIVMPPRTILAEPPVALVDVVARRRSNLASGQAYLEFLYSAAAQRVIAEHGFRATATPAGESAREGDPELLQIDKDFGGWAEAHRRHFAEGGVFDRIHAFAS